jgi:hypothetical protein
LTRAVLAFAVTVRLRTSRDGAPAYSDVHGRSASHQGSSIMTGYIATALLAIAAAVVTTATLAPGPDFGTVQVSLVAPHA